MAWPFRLKKKVLGASLPGENPPKFLLLKPNSLVLSSNRYQKNNWGTGRPWRPYSWSAEGEERL